MGLKARVATACIAFGAWFWQAPARADSYLGIGDGYTINDVKAVLPQAEFSDQNPVWLKAADRFIEVTGRGVNGSVMIHFGNLTRVLAEAADSSPNDDVLRAMASLPPSQTQVVDWVRWVPSVPLKLSSVISKYGMNFKKGTEPTDYSSTLGWPSHAVRAEVGEDRVTVIGLSFYFTPKEYKTALKRNLSRLQVLAVAEIEKTSLRKRAANGSNSGAKPSAVVQESTTPSDTPQPGPSPTQSLSKNAASESTPN